MGFVDERGGDEGIELVTTTSDLQDTYSDSFFDRKVSLPNLEDLKLHSVGSFKRIWHDELSRSSFYKLARITLESCSDLLHVFPSTIIGRLHNLESVEIKNCPSLKTLFDFGPLDSNTEQTMVLLPKLVSINVRRCPSLESLFNWGSLDSNGKDLKLDLVESFKRICHNFVALECLSKLKIIEVVMCDQLKYLWCLSQMQTPVQLEEIRVSECNSMRAIFIDDAGKYVDSTDNRVELPNVRLLSLQSLPNMMSFCTTAGITSEGSPLQVSFPRLESLAMHGLLDLEKILYSQPPLKYSNLKSMVIWDSQSASSILNSDWMLMLPKLELLDIGYSQSTIVFDLNELKVTGHVEILSQLKELTLMMSPNLQHMWKQDVQLQGISAFRNLKKLKVIDTGLAFLFPLSVAKCLREIKDIYVCNCPNMKAVIVDEEGRDEGTDDIIEFPHLKRLSIFQCATEKFFSCPSGKKDLVTTTLDSQDAYSDSFFDRKVSLPSLEKLRLKSLPSLKRIWHGELPRSSFDKLACLKLENCSDLLDAFPSTIIGRLHNLKWVIVSRCPSLESLFDCGSSTEHKIVSLPKLEKVTVIEANRLGHIVKSNSQMVLGFPSLKEVWVAICSELRYLFPYVTAATLENLKLLEINKCEQMKEVVPREEGGRSKVDVLRFPCLIQLRIARCRNFGAFIPSPTSVERPLGETTKENDESPQSLFNETVTFPILRDLAIEGAQCKELWDNQIPIDSFCKLESLMLEDCDNLQHIAPSHIWKRLQHCLETLEVYSCHSIEIIYESDGTVAGSSNLRMLTLRGLDNLRHIWRYDSLPNIPFPNLTMIAVMFCPRLEILLPIFTAEFLGQIKMLMVWSCENMEIIAGHGECEEANGTTITFSKLTKLCLDNLPKFRSYLPEKYSAEFPAIQEFYVDRCGTEPDQGRNWWSTRFHVSFTFRWGEYQLDCDRNWSESEGDEGED